MAVETTSMRPAVARDFHPAFIWAWAICLLFYFMQYAVRSAPGVMIPELTSAFHLSALGVSSLLGVYYYTYSTFAIVSGGRARPVGSKIHAPGWRLGPGHRHHHVWVGHRMGRQCWASIAGRRRRVCLHRRGLPGDPWFPGALPRNCRWLHAVLRHARRIGRTVRGRTTRSRQDRLAAVLDLRRDVDVRDRRCASADRSTPRRGQIAWQRMGHVRTV